MGGISTTTLPAQSVLRPLQLDMSPLELFISLRDRPYPFFLDSSIAHNTLGRYSVVGCEPFLLLSSRGRKITLKSGGEKKEINGNPLEVLRDLLNKYRVERMNHSAFNAGAVGYFSYDLCHFVERLPSTAQPDIALPECWLGFYGAVLYYDHRLRRWYCSGMPEVVESLAEKAVRVNREAPTLSDRPAGKKELRGNFSRRSYIEAVKRAIEYIHAGDVFQVNLSQRFQTKLEISPLELYLRLRKVNPAPFCAFLEVDGGAVLSSSPELFLEVRDGNVRTRPIKGTRPRKKNTRFNSTMRKNLWNSEKDNAELAMIVDLERNDLGRVCSYGTVRVTEPKVLEAYATVYHLVATVEGKLHYGRDLVDLLKATFPGGSITGAPKIRAMEIIDELEPTRRSVYTGSVGYIGLDGDMELNIVIRTILVAEGQAYLQLGGGIVSDSDPEKEYQETLDKGLALFKALGF